MSWNSYTTMRQSSTLASTLLRIFSDLMPIAWFSQKSVVFLVSCDLSRKCVYIKCYGDYLVPSSHLSFDYNYYSWRCLWCNCYRRRKWTRRHEFKFWTRRIAFHITLIPLGKVWIQLFALHLWVNSRTD